MNSLNYPDNLYADHEEAKARARQTPVGAYRSIPELPASERKLRTALSYVNHARDLINEALKLADEERKTPSPAEQREAKVAYDMATESRSDLHEVNRQAMRHPAGIGDVPHERVPKWDVRWGSHPMAAEAIREHDERLQGPEDAL